MPVDPASLLTRDLIRLDEHADDRVQAVRMCGQALVDAGAVEPSYVASMLEREASFSTYLGDGFAIPHGMFAGKDAVHRDALCVLRFPAGVDWGSGTVTVCIGIAAAGDGHVEILAELARILLDPVRAEALRTAQAPEAILSLLVADSAG
ncbi:PTS sugar transporter subunit IIA [Pengzhenrongella sicca]|uniref:Mannitol-specific phosphotransferase enzyme IIA component n=1 Tax=Pengzhenrongella sicca TaxID=2819238 RepID=A0A8A4ZFZ6_9MICO|nr:PTS sugar transporter subunit IIA [Pengzhenrongella sicca]QTE29919.1 PTS sugar transporter subunit IIA [Pengzhenrongella sicca]